MKNVKMLNLINLNNWNVSVKYRLDIRINNRCLIAQVGEFAVVVSTSSRDWQLCLAVLNLWREHRSYKVYSPLDVVAISVEASAAPTKNVFKSVRGHKL